MRIPILIPMKGRGLIDQRSGLNPNPKPPIASAKPRKQKTLGLSALPPTWATVYRLPKLELGVMHFCNTLGSIDRFLP